MNDSKLLRAGLLLIAVAILVSSSFIVGGSVPERPWFKNTIGNLYLLSGMISVFVVSSFTWLKPASSYGKVARIIFAILFGGLVITCLIGVLMPEGGHPSAGGLAVIGLGGLALLLCPIGLIIICVA